MLETLDYTIRIGSIPTFLYFDLYLNSAYAAHFVYIYIYIYICICLYTASSIKVVAANSQMYNPSANSIMGLAHFNILGCSDVFIKTSMTCNYECDECNTN